jgi:hypothetical protein
VKGKLNGAGVDFCTDGAKAEGKYKEEERVGKWIFTDAAGAKEECIFGDDGEGDRSKRRKLG